MVPAGGAVADVTAGPDARTRILDAALALMSEHGSAGTSMRQLAAACDLNVATIYHYFPSKADLLRSVLDERRYGERLSTDAPPLRAADGPRDRLTALLDWLWTQALEEEDVFRLLVGEGMRGEAAATTSAVGVTSALTASIEVWLRSDFPELPAERAGALARVLRGHVFALVVEHLALGGVSVAAARERGAELAAVVFPEP
jgi:AcrR family transcriptional regulator